MALYQTATNASIAKTYYSPTCRSSPDHGRPISRVYFCRSTPPFSAGLTRGGGTSADGDIRRMFEAFDPSIPLSQALTPPSSWYTDPSFLALEFERVFFRGWQAVDTYDMDTPSDMTSSVAPFFPNCQFDGCTEQVKDPNDFFTGRLGKVEFLVCRDAKGKINAFHNVCRHHASILAFGSGKKSCFECPYHGWTYGLDGVLVRATRITGINNFDKHDFGLLPLNVATWGPFILINMDNYLPLEQKASAESVENEWLGSASEILSRNGVDTSLEYICRREYTIDCNWKVFCDNYLDGGYHVLYAHGGLASRLKLDSYSTEIYEKVSIQKCASVPTQTSEPDRLASKALYAFVYPNFMINRYGPWMDTNLALPLGPNKCLVIFDYFLDSSLKKDKDFIDRSLEESERVQIEDIALCEGVQKGLESPAFCCGRYAPSVEMAMHHFHRLHHACLSDA